MSVIIRLQNLPLSAGASDVRSFFMGLKIPDGAVHIIGGPDGDAFIGFASDEDARQAMRRDRSAIHDSEIRLFLSSKTEMNTVVEQVKSGYLSPKESEPDSSPWQQPSPVQEPPANPYAARPGGYTSSYPTPVPIQNNSYENPPQTYSQNKSQDNYQQNNSNYGYRGKFEQRESAPRFSRPEHVPKFENHAENEAPKPFSTLPPHLRPPHGIPPPQFPQFPKREAFDQKPQDDYNGKMRRQDEQPARVASDSWRGNSSYNQSAPKPLIPAPHNGPNPDDLNKFSQRRPLLGNGHPQQRISPPRNGQQPPFQTRPAPFVSGKPEMATTTSEKYYVEMTRLPSDLLRASNLEEFIGPAQSLSLSSVRVVYGPGGIHVATFVRLDNYVDYSKMLKRDGEQGIKIRKASQNDFEEANDGLFQPVPAVVPVEDVRRKRSRSPRRRSPRRRSRERGSRFERSPRRDRSPIRKRRMSRSPIRERRSDHKDPTRWSIQITNVPFRIKEEELMEWFSEKVRPAKLFRTFYSDGNASDRWVAEFSSESLMERAFSIKNLCQGRTLRLLYISNETADEILKIQDVYGLEKKAKNEEKRGEADKLNPPTFFNTTAPPRPLGTNGPPPPLLGAHPIRGAGFVPRGFPPRGGMAMNGGRGYFPGPPGPSGGAPFRGGYQNRGRGGPFAYRPNLINNNGGMQNNQFNGNNGETNVKSEFEDLVNSIGSKGTVLECHHFPRDMTLEDVMDLFKQFEPDQNSVRIRRDANNIVTGECLLACSTPENAEKAANSLNGQMFKDSVVSVSVLNV